jgi:Nif-specific regulatory protein
VSGEISESLYRIGQLFNSILDPDRLFEQVLDEALKVLNAERAMVLLANGGGPGALDIEGAKLEVRACRNIDRAATEVLSDVSRTALAEVVRTRDARVWTDAPRDLPASESIIFGQVHSIAGAPLVSRDKVIGVIYVDSRSDRNVFHEDALPFLKSFASIAALAIENARLYEELARQTGQLRETVRQWQQFPEIIGHSAEMQRVYEMMNRVIPRDAPVIITGETGTGKELVARAIHFNGPRKQGQFVAVNCGAIPENLLESELFGHRRGSFTGAVVDKKGLIEAAGSGTLFLDEVSELPVPLQPKLLRVLQDGEVRRVGDTSPFHVDVRVISATNKSLPTLVKAGKFREDLYYRLNVIPIELPPLRRRREDIPLLVNHFLQQDAERLGKPVRGLARDALGRLVDYPWPGNVRQLENAIERACVLCTGDELGIRDLMLEDVPAADAPDDTASVAEIEKRVVLERLKLFNGNRTRTAASLGISRRTLLNKLAEWKHDEEG